MGKLLLARGSTKCRNLVAITHFDSCGLGIGVSVEACLVVRGRLEGSEILRSAKEFGDEMRLVLLQGMEGNEIFLF